MIKKLEQIRRKYLSLKLLHTKFRSEPINIQLFCIEMISYREAVFSFKNVWVQLSFLKCTNANLFFVWTKANVLEIATSCNNVILKTSNGSQTFWRVRHEATINCTRERERRMLVFILVGFENIPECYSERHFLLLRDGKH